LNFSAKNLVLNDLSKMEKNCGTKSRKKKIFLDNVNYVEEEEFVDFHTFQEM